MSRVNITSEMASRSGQVLIYFIFMMTTFFLCFLLILNTAIHIDYKIQLQNAADMGAYAGAAVIANALNPMDKEAREAQESSIYGLNQLIIEEYNHLLQTLDEHRDFYAEATGTTGWVVGASRLDCEHNCGKANDFNMRFIQSEYNETVGRINEYRNKIASIAKTVNDDANRAAIDTVWANFPGLKGKATTLGGDSGGEGMKNFFITQGKERYGMYLASEVATVPFTHVVYGGTNKACFCAPCNRYFPPAIGVPEEMATDEGSLWMCRVNGMGIANNPYSANLAWVQATRSKRGNMGTIPLIAGKNRWSMPLRVGLDSTKPDPFFLTALEWKPPQLGLDRLFSSNVKDYAVAAAQPFGGDIVAENPYGVRLAPIRQVLLPDDDPLVRLGYRPQWNVSNEDFNGIYEYIKQFGNKNPKKAIQKFLH